MNSLKTFFKQARLLDLSESPMEFQTLTEGPRVLECSSQEDYVQIPVYQGNQKPWKFWR